ncbi:hypothetical protein HI914_01654 [Erysiphe necator]|nr:hypothetical protein HI914_01654 [Erysiphe necator]
MVKIDALKIDSHSTPNCSRQNSVHFSRRTSWGTPIPPPSENETGILNHEEDAFDDVDLHKDSLESIYSQETNSCNTLENISALGLSFEGDNAEFRCTKTFETFSLDDTGDFNSQSSDLKRPFNKWTKNLERRANRRRKTVGYDTNKLTKNIDLFDSPGTQRRSAHKKSSSGSSFGFVTAVKSASISLASLSVATKPKRTALSSRRQRTDQNSKASNLLRASEDSSYIASNPFLDQAVTKRSFQRRRILEEIISTEESYVADVKFLMNVYVTLLASMPCISSNLRASITRNLNEILELHEEILGDLHQVIPFSEYTESNCVKLPSRKLGGHQRWRSLDAVPENSTGVSWLQEIPGMTIEPRVAAKVANVFGKKINRLFIYEEYGAKYEMMIKDIGTTHRTIPQWKTFQKGLEALASSLASISCQQDNTKKAMTIGDLLVKPIQRICKYQLLISELLKQTPVCDCPDSHLSIETVMMRLREATSAINQAADDPQMKSVMEKSWLLQDRISFPDMLNARSKILVRNLGHIHLCGVLHVSWQTQNSVDGKYLICLLYRDYLLLASSPRFDQVYMVQACIGLFGIGIEEVDNGRGLQCHTVKFSWKLIFECDHQLFELTMSACSSSEEQEWRSRLTKYSCRESLFTEEQSIFSSIYLPVKPLGSIFGKPGTVARRMSVHRATTVGPMSGLCQVIIKNTNAFKETTSSIAINRSQSLLTTNRTPVLAPSRAERCRLEALLSDVWSRQSLPYPGMTSRARNEHMVRKSASSMMRKLSVASIASNFTKQSGSAIFTHKELNNSNSPSTHNDGIVNNNKSSLESSSRQQSFQIPDEKENVSHRNSLESLAVMAFGLGNSSTGSTRIETLKSKNSYASNSLRATPPLIRSASNNSNNNLHKLLSLPISVPLSFTVAKDIVEKDLDNSITRSKPPQFSWKNRRSEKVNRKGGSVVVEGIRNFFR